VVRLTSRGIEQVVQLRRMRRAGREARGERNVPGRGRVRELVRVDRRRRAGEGRARGPLRAREHPIGVHRRPGQRRRVITSRRVLRGRISSLHLGGSITEGLGQEGGVVVRGDGVQQQFRDRWRKENKEWKK